MESVFAVTLPFFALVLIGWLAVRSGVLPSETVPGLNGYVLYAALPCMLLRFVLETPLRQLANPVTIGVYGVTAVVTVLLALQVALARHVAMREAAFGSLVAAFPNTGFMGVALLATLFGTSAAGPVIVAMLVDMLLTSSLCIALAQGHHAAKGGRIAAVTAALRGTFSNPLPWAICLGVLMSVVQWNFSGPIDRIVNMLADSGSPVALFAIGAALGKYPVRGQRLSHQSLGSDILAMSLIKILVHPALVWIVAIIVATAGVPVKNEEIRVLVLAAALPSAGNAMMLAGRYGADSARIAAVVLLTTVVAPFTFSSLAWWIGPGI